MVKKIKEWAENWLKKILAEDSSPEKIARGAALGMFIGILPIMGLQTVLAFTLAFFVRANRLAAFAASLVLNPVTIVPLFSFNYWLGTMVTPYALNTKMLKDLFEHPGMSMLIACGLNLMVPLFAGSVISAVCAAVLTYVLVKALFCKYGGMTEKYGKSTNSL